MRQKRPSNVMRNFILLNPRAGEPRSWLPPKDFLFLKDVPLLPVHVGEIGNVGAVLPLALCRDQQQASGWSLYAVCGTDSSRNAFVGEDGTWRVSAAPESVRYLPFA